MLRTAKKLGSKRAQSTSRSPTTRVWTVTPLTSQVIASPTPTWRSVARSVESETGKGIPGAASPRPVHQAPRTSLSDATPLSR